jgi:hypothetical protein
LPDGEVRIWDWAADDRSAERKLLGLNLYGAQREHIEWELAVEWRR